MKTISLSDQNRHILSMISHDIKSPLNGILGFASLIAEESFSLEHKKMAMQIEKAGKDILFLVNNILSMVKMEAGKEKADFKWIPDVQEELEEILRIFSIEARAKKIKLELVIAEPITHVYWDMEKIRLHVINNLISNALKFTPPGGTIRISATKSGETAKISIEDSGPGIPLKFRDSIFEPYMHIDGNQAFRQREGHGLGLYNARLFVAHHGGSIYLDKNQPENLHNVNEKSSEGALSGAKFVIDLPFFPDNFNGNLKIHHN